MLRQCKLLVLDESRMTHKKVIEALNWIFKDSRDCTDMGEMVVFLAGDFQQTLPVIHRGPPAEEISEPVLNHQAYGTATAGSDVVQSGRPIFDDFFQHLWLYIGNNTSNVVFQMVKRLWLIRIDQ
ncbi:hypothetical protein TNCV_3431471 [Trichonephila clavipes]|nr:hypothetical protein TNCV_3431471 [Trichonephila clavipes]